jgi:hypothetical protein
MFTKIFYLLAFAVMVTGCASEHYTRPSIDKNSTTVMMGPVTVPRDEAGHYICRLTNGETYRPVCTGGNVWTLDCICRWWPH